jgi:hypothetical protein
MNIGKTNGVYGIYLWKTHKFVEVLCDMVTDGGGWTVSVLDVLVNIFNQIFS